ncbi:MAG: magnesium transporter [Thermodesulfobacteriota bacterium]
MEEFVQTVKDLLENRQWPELKALLAPKNPNDLAHIFAEFTPSERALLFRLLEKQEAVEVFESLPLEEQQELLGSFKQEQLREIVEHMSPDDRAYLLEELPAKVAKKLVGLLTPEEWAATSLLLGYGENTAGRIMTPEYIDLKSFVTVSQALEKIRRVGLDKETIYYSYVIDEKRRLIGIVSIRQLVLADPKTPVTDIMERDIIHAHTDDDQEEVAHKMQKYDLLAIPVVDREGRLVGIITHDDIIDIIQDEVTEDIYRLGALEVPEQNYFKSRIMVVSGHRLGWLLFLLVANTITGNIIIHYSGLLESVIALAAFVPLLTGSGGNIGSQTSTVFVRGIALKEITTKNAFRLILREVWVGLLLGALLGAIVIVWAFWLQGNWWVALAVGLSLWLISTLATFFGSVWPLVFQRLGLDPAMVSAPFISTVVDVLGALTYFTVASLILSYAR